MAKNGENENGTTLRPPQNKSPLELEENLRVMERKKIEVQRSVVPAQNFQECFLSVGQRIRTKIDLRADNEALSNQNRFAEPT